MATIAATFVPTLWSREGLIQLNKRLVWAQPGIVSDFSSEVAGRGDRINIGRVSAVTVGTYAGTNIGDPQALAGEKQTLLIDQYPYFNFLVDRVDEVHGANVMAEAMAKASYQLAEDADSYVAGLILAGVDSGNTIGSSGSPSDITTTTKYDGAYDTIVDLGTLLDEDNVPADGRWLIAAPAVVNALSKDARFATNAGSDGAAVLRNGFAGSVAGFDVYKSNNCPAASGFTTITVGHSSAIAYGQAMPAQDLTTYDHPGFFGDAVKGLLVYGAKVVEGKSLACAVVSTA